MPNTEYQAARTILLEHGVSVKVPTKSIFSKLLKKTEREFIIKQSTMGTLFRLSELYTQIDAPDDLLTAENLEIHGKRYYKYAKLMCQIVATAYLNSKRPLATWFLTRYLMKRLTPDRLLNMAQLIVVDLNNMQDFLLTTRLMSISPMTMKKADLGPVDNGG